MSGARTGFSIKVSTTCCGYFDLCACRYTALVQQQMVSNTAWYSCQIKINRRRFVVKKDRSKSYDRRYSNYSAGADPTIVRYTAGFVNIYSVTSSLVCF
jgi:hypothetical protein